MAAPGAGPFDPVDARATPAKVTFEAADPSFASGPPPDEVLEVGLVFDDPPGGARFAFGREDDVAHAHLLELVFDCGFSIATVGRHRLGHAPSTLGGASDRGCEHRGVGRIADLDVVVEDHPVLVVEHLGLVAKLNGFAEAALSNRTSIGIVERDETGGAIGDHAGEALARLTG